MNRAPNAVLEMYRQAMETACLEAEAHGYELHEAARAQLERLHYAGVDEDATELMRDQDDDVLAVLVTGDVIRIVADREIAFGRVQVGRMN